MKTKLNPRIETAQMSYQLIFTPGQMSPVRTERTTKPSLKEMQKAVGGLIELAYEGRVDGQDTTLIATIFLSHHQGYYLRDSYCLSGRTTEV